MHMHPDIPARELRNMIQFKIKEFYQDYLVVKNYAIFFQVTIDASINKD